MRVIFIPSYANVVNSVVEHATTTSTNSLLQVGHPEATAMPRQPCNFMLCEFVRWKALPRHHVVQTSPDVHPTYDPLS